MRTASLCVAALLALGPGLAAALQLSAEEAAGKRIFLEGVSASGGEIHARVGAAGTTLPASALPCGSCHGADGRGRPEGGVRPPDITWRRLSTPYGQALNGRVYPAYDEASLARAIVEGRDPAGNRLDPAMPRFVLSPRDLRDLAAYLRRLEDDRDPGLASDRLGLGTLLPTSGPLAGLGRTVEAMLRGGLAQINDAGGIHGRRLELRVVDSGGDAASAEAALRQLLDDDQVFALVAPLAPALDGRFGALLEGSRVPLLGPLSPYGAGESSPLVFEVLPGLREQLLALGRFASRDLDPAAGEALILFPRDAGVAALAERLAERLRAQGWARVRRQDYAGVPGAPAGPPPSALFFLGGETDFAALAQDLQRAGQHPYLLAVSTQVAGSALRLPAEFSGRLFLAYPFVPGDWSAEGVAALTQVRTQAGLDEQHMLLQIGAFSAVQLLGEGLRQAGRDVSRERLVKALEGLHGFRTGLTPPLEFGPGQRVGAAGAHIVGVDIAARRFRPVGDYIRLQRDW
ncbi:Periplasmic binding protein [compost metagenome]